MIHEKARKKALEMLRIGVSQREVAKRCGISTGTAAALAKSLQSPAPKRAKRKPPKSESSGDLSASEMLELATADAERISDAALADVDQTAASRANRALNKAAKVEKRLAANKQVGLTFTPEEWRAANEEVDRMIREVANGPPVHCTQCGILLRVCLPPGFDDAPIAAAPPAPPKRVGTRARESFERSKKIVDVAVSVGNHRAGVRSVVDMLDAADVAASEEIRLRRRDDLITYTPDEAAAEDRLLEELLEKLRADQERLGGICCGECARQIRIWYASNGAAGIAPKGKERA